MTKRIACLAVFWLALGGLAPVSLALDGVDSLRGETPLRQNGPAPRMTPLVETGARQQRNYPEQPPVIPHNIDGYIINSKSNKCLSCHAFSRVGESGAPMISITHFMNRDGQFLASVSPRRYFCTQCHVPQHDTNTLVGNSFVDVEKVIQKKSQ